MPLPLSILVNGLKDEREEQYQMKNEMKKIWVVSLILIMGMMCMTLDASAAPTSETTGAVKNEYSYEEAVFITGQPIVFKGTSKNFKITQTESKGKVTETYNLNLVATNGAKLSRTVSYELDLVDYETIGQKTANGIVKRYSEKIIVGDITYTLADYQFSQGTVTDNRPASDYYSGNIISRKIYTTSGKKGYVPQTITVDIDSRHVGYENFWGATETQLTEMVITDGDGTVGHVKNRLSTSKSRVLNYENNPADLSSFNGGYAVISEKDVISEYTYNLGSGASGKLDLDAENMPTIERLIIPKFRDISSHYAKNSIEKLYSLGIYEDASNFFSPNTPMKRFDFTVAIAKAVDLRVMEDKTTKKPSTTSIFKDVNRTMKNYAYIETAVKKGIIKGVTPDYFKPNDPITRAQAATIFVRALGLENKAPDPSYVTKYKDDAQIPDYARDGVYVMNELGLMTGDSVTGKFNPNQSLTRAQASVMFERFLNYLENDLKQNYRDDILFFE